MQRVDRMVAVAALKPHPRNARTHSKKQIRELADTIAFVGFCAPILIDEENAILAGHARLEAAKLLGLKTIPAVELQGLGDAKKRALVLADNKIATKAGWDREALAVELPELTELLISDGGAIELTGFEPPEIDQILEDFAQASTDPADAPAPASGQPAVTRLGDLWVLGSHRLLCGDARSDVDLARLMERDRAACVFSDPPYNVRIAGVVGRGRRRHAEFQMASGEMSRSEFVSFLQTTLGLAARFSVEGAVHFVCMDWRHYPELTEAAGNIYAQQLNLIVWTKSNAGQGSFYRSQHELIGVFRVGDEPHLNNIELGRHGRNRSNVWHYAGVNSFRTGKTDDLSVHPTVKPVRMVADALKDCTRPRDIVMDTFSGSGTTLQAAERVGRHARAMEIEPQYVDVAIRRWQSFTGRDAMLHADGRTFEEVQAERVHERTGELCTAANDRSIRR